MSYTIEDKMKAIDLVEREGISYREAARRIGVSHESIRRWRLQLEKAPASLYPALNPRASKRGDDPMDPKSLPDDPDELKRIIFDMQFEIDLREAVCDILKKDQGVDPRTLPNREKSLLVDALVRKGTYSIGWMTSSLQLAQATFYYHRKRIGEDPEKELRAKVVEASKAHPEFGYRRIKHALDSERRGFERISEKRIRRIMAKEGLQPPRRRKNSRYSSYDARKDKGEGLPNIPLREDGTHLFTSDAPSALLVSDVTEFCLPNGERVFLSAVLDCFDSTLAGWKASVSEKAEDLTNPSLLIAATKLKGEKRIVHTDRGGHYFSQGWIGICERFNIIRSMSRKGHSPDNARIEGFFGRLKMEFFDTRDWTGVDAKAFIFELDEWLEYYNERRPKRSLGWLSPMQYRRRFLKAS